MKISKELSYALVLKNCERDNGKHEASATKSISKERISMLEKLVDQMAQSVR